MALGLVPAAQWGWTLVPQAFIGAGIALALPWLEQFESEAWAQSASYGPTSSK